MAKSLIAAAVLVLLLGAAYLFRAPSLSPVPGPGTEPGSTAGASAPASGSNRANAGVTQIPSASPAAPSAVAAPTAYAMPASASAADSGAMNTVPATTTFVGPDGNTYDMPPPSPELLALGDSHLRAAVMDEIRADPEAFAKAMHIELEDVQRVAAGEAELPPHWVVQ